MCKSMSVDCDRVGRNEAEPGWYPRGCGRVHRGESEDVCVEGDVNVFIPC